MKGVEDISKLPMVRAEVLRTTLQSELPLMPKLVLSAWIILLRYIVPVILAVLIVVGIA